MVDQASQVLPSVKKLEVMAEKQVQKEDVKELQEEVKELRDFLLRQKQVGAGIPEWRRVSGRAARGGQPAMIVIMFFTHRVKVFGKSNGLLDAALIYTRPHPSLIFQEADDRDIRLQKLVLESAQSNATQVNDLRRDTQARDLSKGRGWFSL